MQEEQQVLFLLASSEFFPKNELEKHVRTILRSQKEKVQIIRKIET
jgi:hypothetical protein